MNVMNFTICERSGLLIADFALPLYEQLVSGSGSQLNPRLSNFPLGSVWDTPSDLVTNSFTERFTALSPKNKE